MKNIILLFLVMFSAISCKKNYEDIEDPGWNQTEITDKITVMTYNVKYCSPMNSNVANIDDIAEVINKAKPDVVFLQEVDKNTTRSGKKDQLKILAEKTNLPYYYYSGAIKYQGGETGIGMLSRYELSDTETFKLPRVELGSQYVSYRVLATATIVLNEKKITLANTHLELTQQNRDLQVPEINKILSAMNRPVIFGGDFNAKPDNKTMQTFFEYGFSKTCTTGCFTIPSDNPNREIDFILYRPATKFEVISHLVINSKASDHMPAVSVLKLK